MLKYIMFLLLVSCVGAQIIPPATGGGSYTLTAAKIGTAGGVTNNGVTINGQLVYNGADLTIAGTGAVSAIDVTNISRGVVAEWATTGTASKATTVTGAQSNRIEAALTNAQQFAVKAVETNWVAGFSNAPVSWDPDFLVPAVTMPDGTVGQMFEEIYVTVRNTSGVTITNGKAVRATSSSGFYSGATLASCTDTFDQVLGVIGLATMTITNGGTGKITLVGNVNEIDTTAFVEGSNLWLSTTAGELTMTKPTAAGCNQVLIGTCLRNNANVGRIGVAVRVVPLPENIGAVATNDARYTAGVTNNQTSVTLNMVRPPNGFERQAAQTVSFNSLTRQAIVTPTGSTFRVTAGGTTYTYGAVTSSAGPDVSGNLFAYFRPSDGVFVCTNVVWAITNGEAQAIYALYDATTTSTVYTVDERHGVNISDEDHLMRHLTVGSTWASGMTISHFGADTATAADAGGSNTCIAITDAGLFYDEDIRHVTVARGTSGGSTNTAGVFPVIYRDTNSVWHKREGTAFPFAWSGNAPTYWTAAGVETAVAEDQYFVYWLLAVGSADGTNLLLVSHPATYASTALAQSGATIANLSSLLGGFPNAEFMVAYRMIFQFNATAPNANPAGVKSAKLRSVDDYRNVPGGVILAGVGAGGGSYELTAEKITEAGGVTGGVFSVGTVVSNVAGTLYIPTNGLGGGTANAVTNGGATINGNAISNGATITISGTGGGANDASTNYFRNAVNLTNLTAAGIATNYQCDPQTILTVTNTSPLTVTAQVNRVYSLTAIGTSNITVALEGTNCIGESWLNMNVTQTNGGTTWFWPSGLYHWNRGTGSSNAPGVSNYGRVEIYHNAQQFQAFHAWTNVPFGAP